MNKRIVFFILLLVISTVSFASEPISQLLGDTPGPEVTLFNPPGTGGTIDNIEFSDNSITWYASSDCTGQAAGSRGAISGDPLFNFTNGVAFHFGQESLFAITGGDTSARCIKLGLTDNSGNAVYLDILNLNCGSPTDPGKCIEGTVCQQGSSGAWISTAQGCT